MRNFQVKDEQINKGNVVANYRDVKENLGNDLVPKPDTVGIDPADVKRTYFGGFDLGGFGVRKCATGKVDLSNKKVVEDQIKQSA